MFLNWAVFSLTYNMLKKILTHPSVSESSNQWVLTQCWARASRCWEEPGWLCSEEEEEESPLQKKTWQPSWQESWGRKLKVTKRHLRGEGGGGYALLTSGRREVRGAEPPCQQKVTGFYFRVSFLKRRFFSVPSNQQKSLTWLWATCGVRTSPVIPAHLLCWDWWWPGTDPDSIPAGREMVVKQTPARTGESNQQSGRAVPCGGCSSGLCAWRQVRSGWAGEGCCCWTGWCVSPSVSGCRTKPGSPPSPCSAARPSGGSPPRWASGSEKRNISLTRSTHRFL